MENIAYYGAFRFRYRKLVRLSVFVSTIFLLFLGMSGYAQNPLTGKALLQYCLEEKELEYDCPKGWTEVFETEVFFPTDEPNSSTHYRIESPYKDVVIVFRFQPFMTIKDSIRVAPMAKVLNPNRTMPARNEQYLVFAKTQADTLSGHKVTYYPERYARKTFGADHAGTYRMLQKYVYRDRYDKCEVVYLFKNDVGMLELLYFYTANSGNIKKLIKKTAGMVHFKKG